MPVDAGLKCVQPQEDGSCSQLPVVQHIRHASIGIDTKMPGAQIEAEYDTKEHHCTQLCSVCCSCQFTLMTSLCQVRQSLRGGKKGIATPNVPLGHSQFVLQYTF